MLKITIAFFAVLFSLPVIAQDTVRMQRDAVLFINAIYDGNLENIQKLTDPSALKSAAFKDFSRKTLKEVEEMKSFKERFLGVDIAGFSNLADRDFRYAREINYVAKISTPGGNVTVSNYIVARSRDGLIWYFADSTRPKGMQRFPNDKTYTADMVKYNRSFWGNIRKFALDFTEPVGVTPIDSVLVIADGTVEHFHGRISRALKVSDQLIFGITFNGPIDTTRNMSGFPGSDGLPYDHNKNYIPSFNVKYDVFPTSYTRQVYNADVAGTYDFLPSKNVHILSPDEKCKVIFIHKDNVVDIEIMFFYVPGAEALLEKYLKLTENMLRFK
jgi:hypothetical protein